MHRVYLSGGIGNQLFQTSFGHYLNWYLGEKVVLLKPNLKFGLPHTRLSFFPKNYVCTHCDFNIHEGNKYMNELLNPWNETKGIGKWRKFADYRRQPLLHPTEIDFSKRSKVFVGYFQNEAFIRPIEDVMRTEILSVLTNRLSVELRSRIPEGVEVIHVRQGDTKSPTNMRRVGILDRVFYRNVLGNVSDYRSRLVVTDDVEGARDVLDGVPVDYIYGPNDLDPWESLFLMAQAKRLVMANSTFSWWGGFLALKNDAEVVIPKPFFVSAELQSEGALKYPGFIEQTSSFMQ